MITLTTAKAVNTVLGSSATVNYDKLVLAPITFDGVLQTISGTVRITSTGSSAETPILGTFRASVPSSELVIEVPQLDFRKRIVLSSGQNNALLAQIEAAQAQVENGLVTLGVIAGTRTAGV